MGSLVRESWIRAQPDSLFRYAKFCPSTQVNSLGCGRRCRRYYKKGVTLSIRFFRRQMNMITKASDMGIPAQPSRRTLAPLPMAATTDGGGVS